MRKFEDRHIGTTRDERNQMLEEIGVESMDILMKEVVPEDIRRSDLPEVGEPMTEREYLKHIRVISEKNRAFRSFIGQGYYGTITPVPILRNIFENPGWYTQYTPYQAEISQGRLEALLNFQTVVSDLTGLPIANASLLDEATSAAEAVSMFHALKNKRLKDNPANKLFVDRHTFGQTIAVLKSRCDAMGIEVVVGDWQSFDPSIDGYFATVVQYPNSQGEVVDYRNWAEHVHEAGLYNIVIADILSLALLTPPGEWGADAVVGNTQRFGVPMGFGGPHAAFFATKSEYKRLIPGRIIGVSVDTRGKRALRMALQTREQHIKREKATSNICTAQALLAIMAGMYAVYHGRDGIRAIATEVNRKTRELAESITALGMELEHSDFFDTLCLKLTKDQLAHLRNSAEEEKINFWYGDDHVMISVDESSTRADIKDLKALFHKCFGSESRQSTTSPAGIPDALRRTSDFMNHEVFHRHNTETELMRYIKRLENKDLSLLHAMIPLGSCTMKLNSATQLMPLSWHAFANVHPFAPGEQTKGYLEVIHELEKDLADITGFAACSLQPNSGAQGELTGLLVIRAYHRDRDDFERNVALIPASAHGTNPASAIMAGMRVVVVKSDDNGNIDIDDLREKAESNRENLSALMVTYPSTHGIFETRIKEICGIIHENGGLVYMDGANMNAQVGLTAPGLIDADVCHLNLHKTFAIPHGGGGPGMGPICANEKLAPFLPGHPYANVGGEKAIAPVNAAPWGSASILLISYAYIKMLGSEGVVRSTENAILNANYLATKLEKHYSILYKGENGRCAHEFILDLRDYKSLGITAEDVAKRLIDYGFHAPTLSFPVAGTFMIEPTESESKRELDRFYKAMVSIKGEIDEVARGEAEVGNNILTNAPHTVDQLMDHAWKFPYSREKAVFPLPELYEEHKFWPAVTRVDNAYGDRNLICTCPPMEAYEDA